MQSGSDAELFVVELCLDSGTPFRRSKPMPMAAAYTLAEEYKEHFPTNVVPAEQYEGKAGKTEGIEDISTNNGYRSRVE